MSEIETQTKIMKTYNVTDGNGDGAIKAASPREADAASQAWLDRREADAASWVREHSDTDDIDTAKNPDPAGQCGKENTMKTVTLLRDVQAGSTQAQIIPAGSRVRYAYDHEKQALPQIIGTARETGLEQSVSVGWEDVLSVGSRVEGGEGEDYDTGTIDSISRVPMPHSEKIASAWRLVAAVRWDRDSGIATNTPIHTLAPI